MSVITDHDVVLGKTNIHISKELRDVWRSNRQLSFNNKESFGVLIGSQSVKADEFWLEKCSTPQKTDTATRTSFNMRAISHQDLVDACFNNSSGRLGYLGTWHTHPEPSPMPSNIDINDWHRCITRNSDRQLLFVIVGQVDFCVFTKFEGKIYRILKEAIDER
jgi:integrative and conjugative element protein (TIGR02256 family)